MPKPRVKQTRALITLRDPKQLEDLNKACRANCQRRDLLFQQWVDEYITKTNQASQAGGRG